MLLEQRTQDRINQAVDQAFLSFLISIIGYAALSEDDKVKASTLGLVQINKPLLESLYQIARERSNPANNKPMKLRDLIAYASIAGTLPLTDTQAYTLEHAKREMYDAIENSREDFKKKVRQEILKANAEMRSRNLAENANIQQRNEQKLVLISSLLLGLESVMTKLQDNFEKGATVALTNMVNNAAVDEASINTLFSPSKELKAYKIVQNDGSLCAWCNKFYTNKDGSPKVYDLKELIANGSNDGKPKSQWLPVVGSTHPRCRCQLHVIKG